VSCQGSGRLVKQQCHVSSAKLQMCNLLLEDAFAQF
jgi:hypothetical protein